MGKGWCDFRFAKTRDPDRPEDTASVADRRGVSLQAVAQSEWRSPSAGVCSRCSWTINRGLTRSRTIRLPVNLMNSMHIELTPKQQEILLRGLRFVRSAVALDMPPVFTDKFESDRHGQYADIAEVESLVTKAAIRQTANA